MARRDMKPWGNCLHAHSDGVEVDLLHIAKGGYSSIHRHIGKHNVFLLIEGAIDVLAFDRPAGNVCLDSTAAMPDRVFQLRMQGDTVTIAAGELHQFRALSYSIVVEVYHSAAPTAGDIERFTQNGCVDEWPKIDGRLAWEPM